MKMKFSLSCIAVVAAAYITPAFSADTNSGVMTVSAIKAQTDDGNFYHYHFVGDYGGVSGSCQRTDGWSINTTDDNINRLLQLSYMSGLTVKVGIDGYSGCKITAVELLPQ
ncbi:hypothetical protein [Phyllobacterium phragmitis]|uniref:Adhesin n=1 Tax=Phyllobacterium phragmitis TaxID=2670329 RepID=A0ABQ0H564_9HYPH